MALNNYKPVIGKKLLQNLIVNLYKDSRTIFREYIQNSCDAIYEAVDRKVLGSVDDGHVEVLLFPVQKTIKIVDNGIGIHSKNAVSILTDISKGTKDGISYAGQYGIGRLVGGGYCEQLVFKTTVEGEDVETILAIDIVELKRVLADDSDDRTAEEIMQDICSVTTSPVEELKHGFEVIMNRVNVAQDVLLDEEKVKDYIVNIAPIDYSTPFKQLIVNSIDDEYKVLFDALHHVRVSVNDHTDLKKKYGLAVSNGDEIRKLRFFKIQDKLFGLMAWGWYAVTKFSTQMNNDPIAGIRLRKHNISLDPDILNTKEYFKETRSNLYFYGEVFIQNNLVVPNSSRDGLVDSDESKALKNGFSEYGINILSQVYQRANQFKNKLKAIVDKLDEFEIKRDELSDSLVDMYQSRIRECQKSFFNLIDKNYCSEVVDVCDIYRAQYECDCQARIEKILSSNKSSSMCANSELEKPKVQNSEKDFLVETSQITDVFDRHQLNEFGQIKETSNSVNKVLGESNSKTLLHNSATEVKQTAKIKQSISNKNIVSDACDRLSDGGYPQDKIALIRRIFGTMIIYCPTSNRTLLEQLMSRTIDDLIQNS